MGLLPKFWKQANSAGPAVLNTQPVEKFYRHPRGSVEVVDIFDTIQGEGPFSGYAAVFIRTAGCNLQCPLCDADYTTNRRFQTVPQIIEQVQAIRKKGLVVLTGGEPFRQNIAPLVKQLHLVGYYVQLETNGTFYDDAFPFGKASIVCSPKTPKISEIPVDAYKYIIEADKVSEEDGLPLSVLGSNVPPARPREIEVHNGTPIYVVPADEQDAEKNQKNLEATIQIVQHFGYILCQQQQKIWGLP